MRGEPETGGSPSLGTGGQWGRPRKIVTYYEPTSNCSIWHVSASWYREPGGSFYVADSCLIVWNLAYGTHLCIVLLRLPSGGYAPAPAAPRSTRSPPTVSAHAHLIGPHAYNFSTNQSDAYTFNTGQSQVYKNSTGQSKACRFSTVGFCWWPVVVKSPTGTTCTQATRRMWAGNPAFKTSKTKQEK